MVNRVEVPYIYTRIVDWFCLQKHRSNQLPCNGIASMTIRKGTQIGLYQCAIFIIAGFLQTNPNHSESTYYMHHESIRIIDLLCAGAPKLYATLTFLYAKKNL